MTARLHSLIALLLFVLLLPNYSHSQDKKTIFGLQMRPIISSGIGSSGPFTIISDDYIVDVDPQTGFAFGMVIRADLTKSITLETGINQASRKYQYDFYDRGRDVSRSTNFKFINYELPVKGLIFIQLGEQLYLDGALGVSIDMYASDVSSGEGNFRQETLRRQWAKFALESNIGVEFRTKKSGYFYFGSTYHNPFSNVARSVIRYENLGLEERIPFKLNAGYLTLDFRYFFHEDADK